MARLTHACMVSGRAASDMHWIKQSSEVSSRCCCYPMLLEEIVGLADKTIDDLSWEFST